MHEPPPGPAPFRWSRDGYWWLEQQLRPHRHALLAAVIVALLAAALVVAIG